MKIQKGNKIYGILIPAVIAILSGCTQDEADPGQKGDGSSAVDVINVSLRTRDGSEETPGDYDTDKEAEKDTEEITDTDIQRLYGMPFKLSFDSNSIIFVSQQTEKSYPYSSDDITYAYKYIEDNEADWEDGYNFTPLDQESPLEWFTIGNRGSFRGGFALYALYFPGRTEIPQRVENNVIYYSVESDQSTLENLIKSDILGAYHSNPTLFTRLRFNLFHLMTYLRIRLYVPVYDREKKTGFYDNALISANLSQASPDFSIEWSALRSSDTEGPAITPGNTEGTITMYMHPIPEGEERETKDDFEYGKYIPDTFYDQGIDGDYDTVKVYDFSVIIPRQGNVTDENGKVDSFTQTNFLNFVMQSNSGAEVKYLFNQALTASSLGNNLQLDQGVFQYLELYVPRIGNNVIYVKGTLNPWGQHTTSLPLHSNEDDSESETSPNE